MGNFITHKRFRRLVVVLSLITLLLIVFIIVSRQAFIAFAVIVIQIALGLSFYIYLKKQESEISKYHQRIYKLIASLKLESHQKDLSLQKTVKSVEELDSLISELEQAIIRKTNDLITKNSELKGKQKEILHQNRELVSAYDALKESRERYEKLVKNLEEEYFFYGLGLDGQVLYVSPSVEKILGYSVSEYKEKSFSLLTKNPVNNAVAKLRSDSLQGRLHPKYIVEAIDKQNIPHILEILEIPNLNADKQVVSIEGLAHEITERYNAEELIKEQEEKYRQVFNSASDFIFIYEIKRDNKPGKFIEANEYTIRNLGYGHHELIEMTPEDLVAAEIWKDAYDRKPNEKYERIWESKDGLIINVEISERYFKIKNQTVCIAVARDISERKRVVEEIKFMNEELINQKENLEALVDNLTQTQEQLVQSEKMAALGQLIAGVAHEINTPLGAIKASIGNLSDSLNSALTNLPELVRSQSEENLNLFLSTFNRAAKITPELSSREKREKKREIRKNLKEKNIEPAELIADLFGYLEIFEDYDDLVNLLNTGESLKVLNNVRDFISLLKNTHTISVAADKASKVVFALKKYAHRDTLGEKVPTDIIDGIETVLTLYDNQLKQGIDIVKNYHCSPFAMCYQDEINQVWTNLIQNAIHAMHQNGILTIEVNADEEKIIVSISDNGEGIEPTIIDKIFEPFFTTKRQGEGSGLGLDIVKKIVEKHNGNIEVKSQLGQGSTFTVQIPLY
ncbi:MAG: PAS domain S-box protein [Bacteroidales bacterium]|nr:PAS domain S-box protein [Bacteroidales bacterium]